MEIWQVAALVAALAGLGTLIFMIWKYFRDEHKKREDKIWELLDTAKEKLKSEREHLNEPMKHFENSLTPFTSTFEGLIRRLELDQLSLKEYWYLDLDFSPFEIHKGQMDIRWEDLPRLTADEQKQNQQFFLALVTKVFYFTQPAYGSRSQRISQELESMINYFGPLKTKDWPTYMSFLGSNVDLVDRLKGRGTTDAVPILPLTPSVTALLILVLSDALALSQAGNTYSKTGVAIQRRESQRSKPHCGAHRP